MIWAPVGLVVAAIVAPHLLGLERASPPAAVTIWLAALALRALACISIVVLLVVWFPATELFEQLTGWCWHAVLPFVLAHLSLNGHRLGDLSAAMPALILAVSLIWVVGGVLRAARAVRRLLRSGGLGPGPRGSLVIGGADVVLAAAGLRRPRVVISAGALTALDDSELAAGLAHEKGHIVRSHRYLLLAGMICCGLARFVPGTQRAVQELAFHLERDADAYALSQRHDRLSLAGAICKSANLRATPALYALGAGPTVTGRVRLLLVDESVPNPGGLRRRVPSVLALTMASLTLAVLIASPLALTAQAQSYSTRAGGGQPHCQS